MVVDYADYGYASRKRISAVETYQKLTDQCWYHGAIKRVTAQELLRRDGDFLVRDSISKLGAYVLTARWRGQPLHFEINQSPSSDPRYELYHFEDEQFRNVVDLVEFYHRHQRRVTESSGLILYTPVINPMRTGKFESRAVHRSEDVTNIEIEAAYAPYLGKVLEVPSVFQRSLSHQALLNSARRRVDGSIYKSEHDLIRAVLANETYSEDRPMATKNETTEEDYSEMDYAAMDDITIEGRQPVISTVHRRSAYIPNEDTSTNGFPQSPLTQSNSRSSHCLNRLHATTLSQDSSVIPSTAFASEDYSNCFDRAQSCQNLFSSTRWRRPLSSTGSQISSSTGTSTSSGDSADGMRRFPSVKIEPPPLLPARSNSELNAMQEPSSSCKDADYDKPQPSAKVTTKEKKSSWEKDYDDVLNMTDSTSATKRAPPTAPKPSMSQLRAISQMSKQMRAFCTFLTNSDARQIALSITEEDCAIFQTVSKCLSFQSLTGGSGHSAQTQAFGKDLLDRSACLHVVVSLTIEKASNPAQFVEIWSNIAKCLMDVGNDFAFGALIPAIQGELNKKQRLWNDLKGGTVSLLRSCLLPAYDSLSAHPSEAATPCAYCFLPFIQPLLEKCPSSHSSNDVFRKNQRDKLDFLWDMLLFCRRLLGAFDAATIESKSVPTEKTENRFTTNSLLSVVYGTEYGATSREMQLKKTCQLAETARTNNHQQIGPISYT
jgi:hypothetical protein